jgi:hypothetical protein
MREAAGAVGHQALALRGADRLAEVGLLRQAVLALAALRRVQRDDVVALLHAGHPGADLDDDAGALVPEDRRKQALRIVAGQGKGSSVWQMPVALISTSTSPAFGPSSWTVSIVRGAPAFQATAARTSMVRSSVVSMPDRAGFPSGRCHWNLSNSAQARNPDHSSGG